jgi:hypothetical protein
MDFGIVDIKIKKQAGGSFEVTPSLSCIFDSTETGTAIYRILVDDSLIAEDSVDWSPNNTLKSGQDKQCLLCTGGCNGATVTFRGGTPLHLAGNCYVPPGYQCGCSLASFDARSRFMNLAHDVRIKVFLRKLINQLGDSIPDFSAANDTLMRTPYVDFGLVNLRFTALGGGMYYITPDLSFGFHDADSGQLVCGVSVNGAPTNTDTAIWNGGSSNCALPPPCTQGCMLGAFDRNYSGLCAVSVDFNPAICICGGRWLPDPGDIPFAHIYHLVPGDTIRADLSPDDSSDNNTFTAVVPYVDFGVADLRFYPVGGGQYEISPLLTHEAGPGDPSAFALYNLYAPGYTHINDTIRVGEGAGCGAPPGCLECNTLVQSTAWNPPPGYAYCKLYDAEPGGTWCNCSGLLTVVSPHGPAVLNPFDTIRAFVSPDDLRSNDTLVMQFDPPCNRDTLRLNSGYSSQFKGVYPVGGVDAFWSVVSDPRHPADSSARPAAVVQFPLNPELNNRWIAARQGNEIDAPAGVTEFEYSFCLPANRSNVTLNIGVRVDDEAYVYLNGDPAPILTRLPPNPWTAPPVFATVTDQSKFFTGRNRIRVRVVNSGGPTGLNVVGYVTQDGPDGVGLAECCSACSCPCVSDPKCDGVLSDVLDVVETINTAFRGFSAPPGEDGICPTSRRDVDGSGDVDVLDVVKVINVAFRGQPAATNYVNPCSP